MKQKAIALALAGVLLFTALFPVRIGIAALDDARIQQAHAVAPAVVLPVLGAIALASGVFLGGVTTSSYNANLSDMYDYIEDFLQTNYDASAETALMATLTPFNTVNMGLVSAQLKNAIAAYVSDNNSDIFYGTDSSQANETLFQLGSYKFNSDAGEIAEYYEAVNHGVAIGPWSDTIGYYIELNGNNGYDRYVIMQFRGGTNYRFATDEYGDVLVFPANIWTIRYRDGVYQSASKTESTGSIYAYDNTYTTRRYFLNREFDFNRTNIGNQVVGESVIEKYKAVVDNALLNAIGNLHGIYEQFVPTDALLQEGISNADLVDAINTNTGTAQDVLSGVNALIGQFTALLTNVGTIGDVIGNIGEDVASIPTVLDDVLEGVLAFPDAISTGLAGVVSAVNAIPASIAGVLEGVTFPIQFPTLPEYDYTGTVSLPVGAWDSFQLSIRDKAPFCYFPRMYNALSAWWNMANVRSFYFDVPLPDGSGQSYVQRFDADDLLSVEYGSTDVATIIRTMVTLSLCFALLYAAVNIAIWSVKGA